MKKITGLLAILIMFIACGQQNDVEKLRKLESKRQKLTARIENLKKQISRTSTETVNRNIPHVEVMVVEEAPFYHYINVQGTVESDNNIFIPAQTGGVVKKIHVKEGERVVKDQLLAELDGSILERRLEQISINLDLASTVYKRQSRLWEKGIGSEVQYLQAKTNKASLEKELAATEEQYKLSKITSPINGSIDEIAIKEGEAVAAGFGTIRVVNLSDMKITGNLSEDYIRRVKAGDTATVNFPVLNISFTSNITAVSQVIDPRNRTFPVDIAIPAATESLQPNILAVITIKDYSNKNALSVPVNVVQKTEKSHFLFIANPEEDATEEMWKVEKRTVKTGLTYQNRVEILSGLAPNEHIIVRGFQELADGQKVIINKLKSEQ